SAFNRGHKGGALRVAEDDQTGRNQVLDVENIADSADAGRTAVARAAVGGQYLKCFLFGGIWHNGTLGVLTGGGGGKFRLIRRSAVLKEQNQAQKKSCDESPHNVPLGRVAPFRLTALTRELRDNEGGDTSQFEISPEESLRLGQVFREKGRFS